MLSDLWREWLYPLGYLAQIAFGLRFLQQWLASERKGESITTCSFWILSLAGNLLLMTHGFFQQQFHLCAIQICSGVIAWRNLTLFSNKYSDRFRAVHVCGIMAILVLLAGFIFLLQNNFKFSTITWFRLPTWKGESVESVGLLWHLFGTMGMLLFASRFWVQWWYAEKSHRSYLGLSFWWLSLIGACITIIYSVYIKDPVNVFGPAIALIPYLRNIVLIARARKGQRDLRDLRDVKTVP